jgi:hypothetical protein
LTPLEVYFSTSDIGSHEKTSKEYCKRNIGDMIPVNIRIEYEPKILKI